MERLKRAKDKNITQIAETVDIGDMVDKIDEIVAWINENEAHIGRALGHMDWHSKHQKTILSLIEEHEQVKELRKERSSG